MYNKYRKDNKVTINIIVIEIEKGSIFGIA